MKKISSLAILAALLGTQACSPSSSTDVATENAKSPLTTASNSNTIKGHIPTPTGVGHPTGYDPNGTINPNTVYNPNVASPKVNAPSMYTPVAWPNIGFHDYSGSLGKKVVALTFDDGPDGVGTGQRNTEAVLDFLKQQGIKASFFVCGNVWTTVTQDTLAQSELKRIVAEGHNIGTHTYTHPHLDTISSAEIISQFSQNLGMARATLGSNFNFTMYRAPFGYPFQGNNPNVSWVAPNVAALGVHVGWGIDTDDWKCASNNQSANCILTNLKSQLDAGHSGPILMHAVYKLTVDTLPDVVAMLRSYGYTFVTIEQMIVDKYGASSSSIQAANQRANFSASQISAFAVSECSKNSYIQVVY